MCRRSLIPHKAHESPYSAIDSSLRNVPPTSTPLNTPPAHFNSHTPNPTDRHDASSESSFGSNGQHPNHGSDDANNNTNNNHYTAHDPRTNSNVFRFNSHSSWSWLVSPSSNMTSVSFNPSLFKSLFSFLSLVYLLRAFSIV